MNWKKCCENCDHNQVCGAWLTEREVAEACDEWLGWIPANWRVPNNSRRVLIKYNFGTETSPRYDVVSGEYHYTAAENEKGFGKWNDCAVAWRELPLGTKDV